jgi:hypothetical protein
MQKFVFTYSGYRLPQHLKQSIKFCRNSNPHAQIVLIVNSELRVNLEVRSLCSVHVVEEKQFQEIQKRLNLRYQDQVNSQNGFWFKSILRFFFIESWIIENNKDVEDFIHLESDCISFIDQDIYASIRNNYDKISVPVDIVGECIPSVVYFPSGNHAIDFSKYIKSRIEKAINLPKFYCSDIAMLNEFKEKDKIVSLPSLPEKAISSNGRLIIFDPKYIGEYLLGKDTRHNKFILTSGSIPISRYRSVLEGFKFNLFESTKYTISINLEHENRQYTVANLHNFSKRYDLFRESVEIKQFKKIIIGINTGQYTKKVAISHLIYFLIDKTEYNIRKVLNNHLY